ncbi:hypothetical protein [Parvularcula marina]|uniref:Aspartyl/asparaginy/proline hydroxylase domain-containing protein n=1 Tax=Parvularcula marina TaxID=2292771 RepID=A0A371RF10_9PROT|nr:hypothetical protein [Parvularcula marina]RFB04023.1 hypothetical protein DX908_01225 [Parvularcula marina]
MLHNLPGMSTTVTSSPIIIENFLPEGMQDELERVIMGMRFPWFYYPNTNSTDDYTQAGESPQFVHGFIQNYKNITQWHTVPRAITARLGIADEKIIRAKCNLMSREKASFIHPKHVDDENPHWVFIYYVNDADGDTCIFDGEEVAHRIKSKRGRGLIFDGMMEHASSAPVDSTHRCVFNFNLARDIPAEIFEKYAV